MTARVRYVLTEQGEAAVPPAAGDVKGQGGAFFTLTAAGEAAFAAWPGNRVEHEPRSGKRPCDGRGCDCSARWSR